MYYFRRDRRASSTPTVFAFLFFLSLLTCRLSGPDIGIPHRIPDLGPDYTGPLGELALFLLLHGTANQPWFYDMFETHIFTINLTLLIQQSFKSHTTRFCIRRNTHFDTQGTHPGRSFPLKTSLYRYIYVYLFLSMITRYFSAAQRRCTGPLSVALPCLPDSASFGNYIIITFRRKFREKWIKIVKKGRFFPNFCQIL